MKSVVKGVYIALIGLVVFTGALFIAQGARTQNEPIEPAAEAAEALEAQRPEPDGPELPL